METRNTPVLREIIEVLSSDLDDAPHALDQLEAHFHDRLLVDAGNGATVSTYAEELRLLTTPEERPKVLDYIAERKMVVITIDVVENAINELLGQERFIEP